MTVIAVSFMVMTLHMGLPIMGRSRGMPVFENSIASLASCSGLTRASHAERGSLHLILPEILGSTLRFARE
ncbi:hypothetical protein [Bosea sp. NBC_00550]|uniref:hypothetical protein n=1 Tax=Bosea sp. NBC_00550 TaxID=2969621 RepID=UPI0022311465|nr:hypothetical protein [Bosea sp. NBC_00550]UZF93668.1 hypothetical protein NWE53_05555 [Bosea sp. NBC_00550]